MRLAEKHWEIKRKRLEEKEEEFINPLNRLSDSEPEEKEEFGSDVEIPEEDNKKKKKVKGEGKK